MSELADLAASSSYRGVAACNCICCLLKLRQQRNDASTCIDRTLRAAGSKTLANSLAQNGLMLVACLMETSPGRIGT